MARLAPLSASLPASDALDALLRQLARLVADELRAEVRAELRRLAAVQVVGEDWTCSVPEAARLLGIDRNTAYDEIRRTGSLAGVPVLKVGERYRVSRLAIAMRLMGEQAGAENTGLLTTRKEMTP